MSFTDIFIRRPVLAICVNLIILLGGYQAIKALNVRQYPRSDIAVVTVKTVYVGASADLVRGFITTPLERVIASADGIDYIESASQQGLSTITVHLKLNYDTNAALAQLQSKVTQVRNDLPPEAESPTLNVETSDNRFASMYISFYSEDLKQNQITDYLLRVVQPKLSAISGVQRADILGARTFAMRIWLKPDRMAALNLSPGDVRDALASNNYLTAVGRTKGSMLTVNLVANTDLHTVQEFEQLVIKESNGTVVRLIDIADVELGAESYEEDVRFSGQKATFMGVWALPTANSLDVVKKVREMIPDIEKDLPVGMKLGIPYDGTRYINSAINEVVKTLIETIGIVIIVIFFFIGSIRSVIVPVVAIPLSLIGAAGLMLVFGFTVNLLTLLAIVLAVGLVVDDAIVMLENIERHVREGLTPMEAGLKGARELVGPIIAMTITLAAVYAPIGFQGGLTGTLFKEFAFTLAGAVVISGFVALTLSPMMSSRLLKPNHSPSNLEVWLVGFFDKLRKGYRGLLAKSLNSYGAVLTAAGLVILLAFPLYMFSTKELAPREDQGIVFGIVQAAPNSSIDQTLLYTDEVNKNFMAVPEYARTFQLINPSFGFSGIVLKPWSERTRTAQMVEGEMWGRLAAVPGVRVIVTTPPPLPGGSDFPVEFVISSTDEPIQTFDFANQLVQQAFGSGMFMFADSDLKYDQPQSEIVFDRDKVASLGLNLKQVGVDLSTMLGGNYVNRFNIQGRSYKVIPQTKRVDRLNPDQLQDYYVSGPTGKLVPVSTFANLKLTTEPRQLNRFQQLSSAKIQAAPVPGVSIDQALKFLEGAAAKILPRGYTIDYAGESRQLRKEGSALVTTLFIAFILIYLVLASQFESFRDPFIILFGSVPLALSGALLFSFLGFTTINIYSQVGLVTLIGLVSKNGILIVEFANHLREQGASKLEAILEAASTRLRPVLMTSVATVAGHFPLILALGPGAGARNSIGIVLVTGMTVGTLFTLFVVPSIYLLIAAKDKQMIEVRNSNGLTKLASRSLALCLFLVLSGCAVGPNFKAPSNNLPERFSLNPEGFSDKSPELQWWTGFNDAVLEKLVTEAIRNNKDIDVALARFRQARASHSESSMDLIPTIQANGSHSESRSSTINLRGQTGRPRDQGIFDAGFDAFWELDFFGRVRRGVEASSARQSAGLSDLQDALRSVIAEVARNYFELRGTQKSLEVARHNASSQSETVRLTQDLVSGGMNSELDIARAQAQLGITQATIPTLEADEKAIIYRLAVLTGKQPVTLLNELTVAQPIPQYKGPVQIGNPAEMIRRRPDVRAAEDRLAASTADIGVAVGDFFPKVTFTGNLAFQATAISDVGSAASQHYSFGPGISWAALDLGRVRARMVAAGARNEEQLAIYENTVLKALEEIESALVRFSNERQRADHLRSSARFSLRAAELARTQYQAGLIDLLNVLDTERVLLQAEEQLARSETALLTDLVAIYKALGGGWEDAQVEVLEASHE